MIAGADKLLWWVQGDRCNNSVLGVVCAEFRATVVTRRAGDQISVRLEMRRATVGANHVCANQCPPIMSPMCAESLLRLEGAAGKYFGLFVPMRGFGTLHLTSMHCCLTEASKPRARWGIHLRRTRLAFHRRPGALGPRTRSPRCCPHPAHARPALRSHYRGLRQSVVSQYFLRQV